MNRMVNTSTDVLTERIQCPDINDVNFASELRSVFETINDNFARLSNHDFIKGESGTSVYIKKEPIYNGSTLSTFGNNLKNYLKRQINETDETLNSDGITLDYFGNFTQENAGSLQVIYNKSNDIASDDIAVSSLQYVFLDGRFWNDKVGIVDQSVYDGIEDMSCIVIYDNGKFESLNGALPTMYYERGVGLCWKLNGKPTGMPVQGIPGKDGQNALMRIVKVGNITHDEDKDLSIGDVTSIFEEKSGYIDITEDIDINDYANSSALIISSGKVYIGLLEIETYTDEDGKSKDKLIAICDPAISLNETITSETIYNQFKKISLTKNNDNPSHLQGLFIPINASDSEKSQAAHLISASPIINTYDSDNLPNSDILFTPVNDIDNINPDEEKPLNVDKYLYLKVNNEYLKLSDFSTFNNPDNNFDNRLSKYNYCIKYKLIGIAKSKDNTYLQPNFSEEEGGLCYTYTDELSTHENVKIDNSNVVYANTLPNDLESNPFYIWEVQSESASYDIDELKAVASKGNDSNPYADVPSAFKYICTRTITPGSSSKIHWFDVLDIEKENDTTYSIPGWHESNHIFNFIKFVPVFKDESYHVNDDTAVNFNYNVNITGCDHANSEVKRNLSVHGDINCDNINIDGVVASKEIDTIYTKNEIVGESGLKLCKTTSDDETENHYQFSVDNDGNVQAINVNAKDVSVDNVSAKSFNSNDCTVTDSFLLKGSANTINTYYEKELVKLNSIKSNFPYPSVEVNASFDNVRNFDISGDGTTNSENTSKMSVSQMPMIFTNNGNIVVTNQEKNNSELYHYGVPVRDESGSKNNVFSNNVDFDNAKKFNMVNIKAKTATSFYNKDITSDSYVTKLYNNRGISTTKDGAEQNLSQKFSAEHIYNMHKLTGIAGLTFEQSLDNTFLEKFTIDMGKKEYSDLKFENSEPINIKLNHKYICHIGIKGENHRGSWPTLHNNSYMKLKLYYKIGDSGDVIDSGIEKQYTIPTTPEEWTSTSAYNTNGTLETSGDWAWRYRGFSFYAGLFQLKYDKYKELFYSLENGGKVTFWIFPEFYIYTVSSKGTFRKEYCIKGLEVYLPMATKTIGSISSAATLLSSTLLSLSAAENGTYSINNMNNHVRSESSSKISFTVSSTNSDKKHFNNTVKCNDGMVLRSNNSFIGFGYTNDSYIDHENYTTNETRNYWTENNFVKPNKQKVPIICYYEFDEKQFTSDSEFTDDKVARKMMVIPIKDIFTAIRVLKTKFPTEWGDAEKFNIY